MAKACRLYLGMLSALALCKYSLEEWNATEEPANPTVSPCHHHGNRNNCTADPNKETGEWSGHFTKCPKALKHYCIHGDCRYIEEQKVPSCRCEHGFIGSRCQYYDLGLQIGEQRQIIIACVITGLVFLILLIVFICMCSHRRYALCKRRPRRTEEEPRNGTEKLNMIDTGEAHRTLMPDSTEHTNDL